LTGAAAALFNGGGLGIDVRGIVKSRVGPGGFASDVE